jgi:hypothetical protein
MIAGPVTACVARREARRLREERASMSIHMSEVKAAASVIDSDERDVLTRVVNCVFLSRYSIPQSPFTPVS